MITPRSIAPTRALRASVVVALLVAAVLAGSGAPAAAQTNLVGTFALTPGACQSGTASGTYFRMVQPSGTVAGGPFVSNGDSTCADKTYTLLSPGSDGGAITGAYQPAPAPAFDGQGNSLANRIVMPTLFFGVRFGLSTDPTDRQTGTAVPSLSIAVDDEGRLTGDLRAWEATWNKQDFNQGSPKPDGSRPKLTTPARGTYNASTGAFVLEWTSTIVGGPFNEFTGSWHLAGTFRAAGSAPAAAAKAPAGDARTSTGAGTATTVAGTDPAATSDTTAVAGGETAAASGDAKIVGAVTEKGWKPPAWLIVVTAVVGIAAAFALLMPTRRAASDGTDE